MWKSIWTVGRDLQLLGVGTFGVLHEELSGHTSIPLLVVYTTMLGIPGAAATLWLGRTGSASSPPPPAESSQPPSGQ